RRKFAVSWIWNEAELLWLRGSLEFVLSRNSAATLVQDSRGICRNTCSTSSWVELSPHHAESAQAHGIQYARRVASRVEAGRYKHIRVQDYPAIRTAMQSANPRPSAAAGCSSQTVDELDACEVLLGCLQAGSRRATAVCVPRAVVEWAGESPAAHPISGHAHRKTIATAVRHRRPTSRRPTPDHERLTANAPSRALTPGAWDCPPKRSNSADCRSASCLTSRRRKAYLR